MKLSALTLTAALLAVAAPATAAQSEKPPARGAGAAAAATPPAATGSAPGAAPKASPTAPARRAVAVMKDAKGKVVGEVVLEQSPQGLLVIGELKGLPPGSHAFHVHEAGRCEPPAFKSAGGHFNPAGRTHGLHSEHGMHAGDLPNIAVAADGRARFEQLATALSLEEGRPGFLLDADGSALVVHAAADDYRSDPTGNAGDRIACGVVEKR